VELAGVALGDMDDLQRLMTDEQIGRRLDATVVRGGEMRSIAVVPAELGPYIPG
jgi:hypothetical protein